MSHIKFSDHVFIYDAVLCSRVCRTVCMCVYVGGSIAKIRAIMLDCSPIYGIVIPICILCHRISDGISQYYLVRRKKKWRQRRRSHRWPIIHYRIRQIKALKHIYMLREQVPFAGLSLRPFFSLLPALYLVYPS